MLLEEDILAVLQNPFGKMDSGRVPEAEIPLVVGRNESIDNAVEYFQKITKEEWDPHFYGYDMPDLTPAEINLLTNILLSQQNQNKPDAKIGIFLARHIQKSYEAGHTKFLLDLNERTLAKLMCIKATGNRRLELVVRGNVTNYFGSHLNNCDVDVQGNVGLRCFQHDNDSTIMVRKNTEGGFGDYGVSSYYFVQGSSVAFGSSGNHAYRSVFHIRGSVSYEYMKEAKECLVIIKGNAPGYLGKKAERCAFIVDGSANYGCGAGATESIFLLKGGIEKDRLGNEASKSVYIIEGDLEHSFGKKARHCRFYVKGDIKEGMSESEYCYLEVHGKIKDISDLEKKNIRLAVRDRELYRQLRKQYQKASWLTRARKWD